MLRLQVVGPFRGSTGYDRHTREFVRQLIRLGVQVRLIELPGWSIPLPADKQDPLFEGLTLPVEAEMVLHFTMPNHAQPVPGKKNINYTMFEADGIPADWAQRAMAHDLIVLPTESSCQAWINSGVPPERLRLCPLGIDGDFFSVRTNPLPLETPGRRPVSAYTYRFLNVAELRPRKNHLGLIRSWIQATQPRDDAVLIIKVTAFQAQNLEWFREDLEHMQRQLGKSLADAAPVIFIQGILSHEDLRSLYQTATHYISMSKGEGWDQVMMEAAVSGLHLIAPHHSAYASYLGEDDAHLIPAKLVPAVFEGRLGSEDSIFFNGLSWWQPDEDAAVDILHKILRSSSPGKPSPGKRLMAEYSWENAGKRLFSILQQHG